MWVYSPSTSLKSTTCHPASHIPLCWHVGKEESISPLSSLGLQPYASLSWQPKCLGADAWGQIVGIKCISDQCLGLMIFHTPQLIDLYLPF